MCNPNVPRSFGIDDRHRWFGINVAQGFAVPTIGYKAPIQWP
jgi:hypothetical protein